MKRDEIFESFQVCCDWAEDRGRVALIGSQGTEVLIVVQIPGIGHAEQPHDEVMRVSESRLRAALLALVGDSWPAS